MKKNALILVAVMCMAAGHAMAVDDFFVEVTGPPYEWIDDNFSIGWVPASEDSAIFRGDVSGEVNGQSGVCSELLIDGGATLTLNSGRIDSLREASGYGVQIGTRNGETVGGTLNVNGGVLDVPNRWGVHGVIVVGRYENTSYLNQTGGLIQNLGINVNNGDLAGTLVVAGMSSTVKSYYNMSGGTLNTHSLLIAHQSATGGAEMHVSGSAEINISGDRYNAGIHLNENSLFTVTGGDASINLVEGIKFGGWNKQPGTHTLVYNIDGTGASTINAESLDATELDVDNNPSQNFLELNALAGITGGTYTLIHTIPGRDPTNNLQWITQTGDANFTNLQVVDIAGDGSLGYDITVDYGTGGPLMGDVNLSGYVDDDDLSLLLAGWGTGTTWGEGDLDLSGDVGDDDLSLLLASWGDGTPPAPQAVPEPATMAMLAIGGLGVLLRRRR